MSYRVRFTKPNGETGYWERTFATRAGATTTADHARDSTGYAHTVEEMADAPTAAVPDATPDPTASNWPGQTASTSTTERLVAMLRERHDRGLAKYGVTVDRGDLTPDQWAQHAIEELLDGAAYLMRLKDTMAEARASMDAHIRRLEEAGKMLDAAADAADADITQHLQVANYNLHGLLNTGDRIDPPNPPQTIHQAGIDASVSVRHQVRIARQAWRQAKEAKP